MTTNFANATISLDETLADLRVKTQEDAQRISKSGQTFFLAKLSVKEPDESKPTQTIVGWISKNEYEVIDAVTEKRYTSQRAEFSVLEYL